jgi:hypothetical protein
MTYVAFFVWVWIAICIQLLPYFFGQKLIKNSTNQSNK